MEVLLGPLGLLAGAIAVILGAIKNPPLWYPPSAMRAKEAELVEARKETERVRAEAEAAMRDQRAGSAAVVAEWKATAGKWEQLALMQSGVIEKTIPVAVVKPLVEP